VAVPDRLSVVGHDDIPLAAVLQPALTTVRQPMRDLGEQAVHMLQAQLQRKVQLSLVRLMPQLVVRASTAAPPLSP
jgi:DNA-binding LacI/PurR family transcriptional regulator